jgi:hypothetical protein
MDFHVKLVKLTEKGNHLIVITRGLVDAEAFKQIIRKIGETTRSLPQCMVLVDLEDAELKLEPSDFHAVAHGFDPELWPRTKKIALVSSDVGTFDRLCALGQTLCNAALKVAVFSEDKAAVSWLSDTV